MKTAKTYERGTHRARDPEHTWDLMAPKLARFGITRVADVTYLDVIGIPVVMSVRPLSKVLSVSQGKGQTLTLAKVSAVMESVELWHAETAYPPLTRRRTPATELDLPYALNDLVRDSSALVTETTRLDWIGATGLVSGRATEVPFGVVCFTEYVERPWTPYGIVTTSNGLASGNNLPEAVLHALYEVIERDAISRTVRDDHRTFIDPRTVDDPDCAHMIRQIGAAGVELRLAHVPSSTGVPCFEAELWSPEFPVITLGAGAHLAAEVALSRAITEAAQSRLTSIAGSRDDQAAVYEHVSTAGGGRPAPSATTHSWAGFAAAPVPSFADLEEEMAAVTILAAGLGGEPLLVDLSTDEDFAVVKVIVPGAVLNPARVHPDGDDDFSEETW